MKKCLYLFVGFTLLFLTACQLQEETKEIEPIEEENPALMECEVTNEDELYHETFKKETENWQLILEVEGFGEEAKIQEEANLELTYLGSFSADRFEFEYEVILDKPANESFGVEDRLLKGQKTREQVFPNRGFIKALECDILLIEVKWEDEDGKEQLDHFYFPEDIVTTRESLEEKFFYAQRVLHDDVNSLMQVKVNEGVKAESDEAGEVELYLSHNKTWPEVDLLENIEHYTEVYVDILAKDYNIDKITVHWQVPELAEEEYLVKFVLERELEKFKIIDFEYDAEQFE